MSDFTADELTTLHLALAHEYEVQQREFEKELYAGNLRDDMGQPIHGQAVTQVVKEYWGPRLQVLVDLLRKVATLTTALSAPTPPTVDPAPAPEPLTYPAPGDVTGLTP